MNYNPDSINNILRPALKNRIGTQENINGARTIAQNEWHTTSLNAGQLAYALVMEAALWADGNVQNVYIPDNALDDATIKRMGDICAQANNSHDTSGTAFTGAAFGSLFGFTGAVIGGLFGWALGQNAANNDIQSIAFYANQAIDYMCDTIVTKIRLLGYSAPQNNGISLNKETGFSNEFKKSSVNLNKPISSLTEKEKLELITEYKKLYDNGVITEEEFNAKKKALLK